MSDRRRGPGDRRRGLIDRILRFSLEHRVAVVLVTLLLVVVGVRVLVLLPIDAVPDITNRQVQLNAKAGALGPEEMERLVTFPLEISLAGLPHLQETRSISQFGLSQVTIIFDDDLDIYFARQLVNERLQEVRTQLPAGVDVEMAPISTGLGEILYLRIDNPKLGLMERRTLMDWTIRPQLRTVRGLAEVNTWGGQVQQYQVLVDPARLQAYRLTLRDVVQAVAQSNSNAGGGTILRGQEQQTVRTVGVIQTLDDLRHTVLTSQGGVGVTLEQVANVTVGPMIRQGAITRDGKEEDVFAISMLLMGENGRIVLDRVKDRLVQMEKSLPAGSKLVPFLDRSELISRTLHTALRNLAEGGLLVVLLLFLFLGQLRAGLIVSSSIPLAMLFAVIGMYHYQVSANLMSLGAVDFGLIVDGSVIIVENCIRRLALEREQLGRKLTEKERLRLLIDATCEVRKATQFGEMIIIASYLPILSLEGLEGKMFRPMGLTVVLALLGALLLSFTVTPALCGLFLRSTRETSPALLERLKTIYCALLARFLGRPWLIWGPTLVLLVVCLLPASRLGSEFIPELDEGSIAIQATYLPGSSLDTVVERQLAMENLVRSNFPDEAGDIVSRIGRPEIATDPMQVFQVDCLVVLKPVSQWKRAHSREELVQLLDQELSVLPGASLSFSQPIKMRMMELIEGVGIRSDLGIKLFGASQEVLEEKGREIERVVRSVPGAEDVSVETTTGLPRLEILINRQQAARFGIRVDDINQIVDAALGGQAVTQVNDGTRRIDVAVRLPEAYRNNPESLSRLLIPTPSGGQIPLSTVADIRASDGPAQISRENGQRRVVIQSNVRNRDLGSFVDEVRRRLDAAVKLPTGYHLEYGGTYEKMESGRARLAAVVPVTFLLVLGLLYLSFQDVRQALLVFVGVPMAACGGVLALWLRGMTFSISAAIGFIALAGVAVLNGVVMLHFMRDLRLGGRSLLEAALEGASERLRPVLMTASVAGFGFVPMALSTGAGAEVQKPLATVVIGGLITSSLLTLFVLPTLWVALERWRGDSPRSPLPADEPGLRIGE